MFGSAAIAATMKWLQQGRSSPNRSVEIGYHSGSPHQHMPRSYDGVQLPKQLFTLADKPLVGHQVKRHQSMAITAFPINWPDSTARCTSVVSVRSNFAAIAWLNTSLSNARVSRSITRAHSCAESA